MINVFSKIVIYGRWRFVYIFNKSVLVVTDLSEATIQFREYANASDLYYSSASLLKTINSDGSYRKFAFRIQLVNLKTLASNTPKKNLDLQQSN